MPEEDFERGTGQLTPTGERRLRGMADRWESTAAVVVIERGLSPGFAGIPNPLFAADNTLMLFGDGREAILEIIKAVRES